MVFILVRDSKSPQFSRNLLNILADLNNVEVWMVSTRPVIYKSSSPFYNHLVTISRVPITIGTNVTFFRFHSKVQVLSLLFTFFQSYSVVSRESKVHNFASSLFLHLIIIRSGRQAKIRRSVCMLKSHRSLCFILLDRFWVVDIPFVPMVKFKCLAQLPVDHLAHPVISSFIILLCQFAAFAYLVIDRFVSITT